MRPVATEQNIFKYPLNVLLSTEANIRILRLLSDEVATSISVTDAAKKTDLTEAGTRRALDRLEKTGFVERLGGKHSSQFRLHRSEPLTTQLSGLFIAERERYQQFIRKIRKVMAAFTEITLSWIDVEPVRLGQPLQIGVQSDSRSLTYLPEQIRNRILEIEKEFDLTIEIRTISPAEDQSISFENKEILSGIAPSKGPFEHQTNPKHDAKEKRAARLNKSFAGIIDKDPSIIKRAQKHLERLLEDDQGAAAHELREWLNILINYSPNRVRDFLLSNIARSIRLRQSSPFFAVLTTDERDYVLTELENQN